MHYVVPKLLPCYAIGSSSCLRGDSQGELLGNLFFDAKQLHTGFMGEKLLASLASGLGSGLLLYLLLLQALSMA